MKSDDKYLDITDIKTINRYKTFTVLANPIFFSTWQKDTDIYRVQVHSMYKFPLVWTDGYTIAGFCGAFGWNNNQIVNIDGDTYDPEMLVYAYEWHQYDGEACLDILVKEW